MFKGIIVDIFPMTLSSSFRTRTFINLQCVRVCANSDAIGKRCNIFGDKWACRRNEMRTACSKTHAHTHTHPHTQNRRVQIVFAACARYCGVLPPAYLQMAAAPGKLQRKRVRRTTHNHIHMQRHTEHGNHARNFPYRVYTHMAPARHKRRRRVRARARDTPAQFTSHNVVKNFRNRFRSCARVASQFRAAIT